VAITVSVISDSTNTVIATIPVGTQPQAIVYDPAKGEIFVANSNYNNAIASTICTVSVISDSTNNVIATIDVGAGPLGMAYDSAKGEIFVSNEISSSISIISDSNNKVVATADGVACPEGMVYNPKKGEIFIANYCAASVSILSDQNNMVTNNFLGVGGYAHAAAYDSGKGQVWIGSGVISDSNDAMIAVVQSAGAIAYDSSKGEIYMANNGENTVYVISDVFNITSISTSVAASSPKVTTPAASPQTDISSTPAYHSAPGFPWWIVIVIIIILLLLIIRRRRKARRSKKNKS
jgi:YVTN family beta-propeller protein